MSFPYKRYIVIISNQDSKLSTLMAKWKNSYNFHTGSLRNYLHYGIGFVNSILFSLGLCGCLKLLVFGVKWWGAYGFLSSGSMTI